MIVAVVAVRVVQPTFDEVVLVVAVRHLFVSAIVVLAFALHRRANRRIRRTHRDDVFVVVAGMGMMQVAVVEVIDVAIVFDFRMPTMVAVDVRVIVVCLTGHVVALLHGVRKVLSE